MGGVRIYYMRGRGWQGGLAVAIIDLVRRDRGSCSASRERSAGVGAVILLAECTPAESSASRVCISFVKAGYHKC